jgi:hypothetical protein
MEGDGAVNLEEMFKKGTKVKMILRCKGIWISNVGWGCTWSAEQIKIDVPVGFSGYAFDDSDDDDGCELVRQSTAVTKKSDNFVESDEESGGGSVGGSGGGSVAESVSGSEDESDGEEEQPEEQVVKRKVKK